MIVIYGASGHGKVVAASAQSGMIEIAYFLDDNEKQKSFLGYEVHQKLNSDHKVFIGIGNNRTRKMIVEQNNFIFASSIVDATATVRSSFPLSEGTFIGASAVVNPDVSIGKHTVINTAVVVEHDCKIGEYVHISPNATLAGGVVVGEGTHIGSGTVIIPEVKIGKWCVIGAGSVILKDVPDNATVVGNPGKIIKIIDSDNM